MDFLIQLFSAEGFPPRWYCGEWTRFHGWFYILSNLGVWAAYTTIPLLLVYFISRRKTTPFLPIFWLFAAFILFCGATHLIDALLFWWPAYRFSAVVLFATAVVSWITVLALVPAIPQALALKSPHELEREVIERRKAEEELRRVNENLEQIVAERTRALKHQTRQLKIANGELEAFSYSVSHDLRAPLNHVNRFSQFLLKDYPQDLDETATDYLNRIRKNVDNMNALIDAMLKLSRLSRQEIKITSVNLSEKAQSSFHDLQEANPGRKIQWKCQDGIVVKGDPTLLWQVIENLLSNAWKYTRTQENPEIEFGQTERDGETVYFVRDNGIGFDMKYAPDLFVPFKRLDYARGFEGTGIGLATVQRIIHRHGGHVWAEGKPGQGATFYFTLGSPQNMQNYQGSLNKPLPMGESNVLKTPDSLS